MPEETSLHGIRIRDEGPVRVITLDRPQRRNALDPLMRAALAEAVERAADAEEVRAIVLTGAGTVFCSGGDFAGLGRLSPEDAAAQVDTAQRIAAAVAGCGTPVIAAVEGGAYGAGLALAAACDRIVAASDARFAGTFTVVGLAADLGALWSLPRRIGPGLARQMLMFGEMLDAPEARRVGLVDAVVDQGTALDVALADARRFADGPPLALSLLKQAMAHPALDLPGALKAEAAIQIELAGSDDFAEGVAAFTEKRRPRFSGT